MINKIGRREDVPIEDIIINKRLRVATDEGIEDLAESIRVNSLGTPIILTDGISDDLVLVAGARRILAYQFLGWKTIPATIFDFNALEAELMEIDENLKRKDLTVLERGEHLARRKEIYEELFPETKMGGAPGAGRGKAPKVADSATLGRFTQDAAKKTGRSERVIQEDIAIAKNLDPKAKEDLMGTKVANKKGQLAEISRKPPAEQRRIAKAVKAGEKMDKPEVEWNTLMDNLSKEVKAIHRKVMKETKEHPDDDLKECVKSTMSDRIKSYVVKLSQAKN